MAWKKVSRPPTLDIKKQVDEEHVGVYQGKKDIQTKLGPQVVHEFDDQKGAQFSIYGFTNLNRAMEGVRIGGLVRVKYLGTEKVQTKFGLKDVHQVSVEIHEVEEDSSERTF